MALNLTYLDTVINTKAVSDRKQENRMIISQGGKQQIFRLNKDGILEAENPKEKVIQVTEADSDGSLETEAGESLETGAGRQQILILPEKWNQESFDFVFIQGLELYCVQCTLSPRHSRAMQPIGEMIKLCREMSILVEKVHLVALTDKPEFKFKTPGGSAADIDEITCWRAQYIV